MSLAVQAVWSEPVSPEFPVKQGKYSVVPVLLVTAGLAGATWHQMPSSSR